MPAQIQKTITILIAEDKPAGFKGKADFSLLKLWPSDDSMFSNDKTTNYTNVN